MTVSILDAATRAAYTAAIYQQTQCEAVIAPWAGGNVTVRVLGSGGALRQTITLGPWTIAPTTPREVRHGARLAFTTVSTGDVHLLEYRTAGGATIFTASAGEGATAAAVDFAGPIRNLCGITLAGAVFTANPSLPVDVPAYAWASSLATNSFNYIAGSQFRTWGLANITGGPFRGTDPIGSIVNSYNDPAVDEANGLIYFHGGGHGDGSCNAVVRCDPRTFSYSVAVPATPASVYLPGYMNTLTPLTYPSGVPFSTNGSDYFLTVAEGLDPVIDAAHIAPRLARVVTHMYAAAAFRGTKCYYFYLSYGEADVVTGEWSGRGTNLGAQLQAISSGYGNTIPNVFTRAVYDSVTDRFFVTMPNAGQRNGFFVFNPNTRQIVSTHDGNFGALIDETPLVKIGRKLYCFRRTQPGGFSGEQNLNQGFIVDMDQMAAATGRNTMVAQQFVLTGDTDGSSYTPSPRQETIPCYWDGVAIRRWNYESSKRGRIYSVNINPLSGLGTVASPFVFQQTRTDLAGTPPADVQFVYSRLIYIPEANAAICIPRDNSDWFALRIT